MRPSEPHALPFEAAVCVQPLPGWQESTVQGLPSSQLSGAPAVHTPDWHVSAPLHASLSGHAVPLVAAGYTQPPLARSQVAPVAVWQTGGAVHATGVPATHAPCWHVSTPLHGLPSEQLEPFGSAGYSHIDDCGLHTPAAERHTGGCVHSIGVPATQLPPTQVSRPLHAFPSEQLVPLDAVG